MVIHRLGKARESTMLAAEDFKRVVRKYMESMGYAQRTDSLTEGHLHDTVFEPIGTTAGPMILSEAKAKKLSLADKDFAREFAGYLQHWSVLRPEARFKLMVFAQQLVKPERWEDLFGPRVTLAAVTAWLASADYAPTVDERDLLSFFVETTIVDADADELLRSAQHREEQRSAAGTIRRQAKERLDLMTRRARPVPRKSILLSNMVHFTPPQEYRVVRIEPLATTEVHQRLRFADCPPYVVLRSGELLTHASTDTEEAFAPVRPRSSRVLSLAETLEQHERELIRLLNEGFEDLTRRRGVSYHKGRGFFLCERDLERGADRRKIPVGDRGMTVAKAYFPKDLEEELRTKEGLNFVLHEAFTLRTRRLWGDFYVVLGLRRLYTKDGRHPFEDDDAARIDANFRRPEYNRSDTQQSKTRNLLDYFFLEPTGPPWPAWAEEFRFHDILHVETPWSPEAVSRKQGMLSEFGEATE